MLQVSNSSVKSLKIAIGVGGRFHADRMADALIKQGHHPTVFSSLPKFRFQSLPPSTVQSFIYPELVFRTLRKMNRERLGSDFKMESFGKILAKKLTRENWDLFVGWSSFSKEVLEKRVASKHVLMRDSSHITFQMDVLENEYRRLGIPFERDKVAEQRECIEYDLADEIFVLSDFAKKTFQEKGIKDSKIKVIRLGVDSSLFNPKQPRPRTTPQSLNVVYFGSLSVRKGVPYLLDCVKRFRKEPINFHLVGHVENDLKSFLHSQPNLHFYSAMSQPQLAEFIKKMDVFVFPTLEDGFGQTLIQAMASGLVPIFSDQCGAGELVRENEGVKVRAGSTDALEQALKFLMENPSKLITFQEEAARKGREVEWATYNQQLSNLIQSN